MADEAKLFATTRWTMVIQAAGDGHGSGVEALDQLCQAYWRPLYVFLRRTGHSAPDAEDLTQGFLAHLLSRQGLRHAAPCKGRFRSFLLASLKHYLANEWHKAQAQKRGRGEVPISLNDPDAERSYQLEPADHLTPDRVYDRQWAHTLLQVARRRLMEEYATGIRCVRFEYLASFLPGEQSPISQAQAAARLGLSEGAFRVEVHRFRQRFAELLRAEVAEAVAFTEEVDDELRYLIAIVSE